MHERVKAMIVALAVLIATGCSMGSTGPTTGANGSSVPAGGASATIVASGSASTGGNTGGYGGVTTMSTTYSFNPVPDTVAVGAVVTYQFQDVAHTVTFDQVAGPIANIPATANADSTRVFRAAGTYTYHCSIHTYMHGTVVAQ